MKSLFGILFIFTSISLQGQDSLFQNQVKEYIKYKKYMYVDYIPKEKIPKVLKDNFYSDLSPTKFTHNIGQNLDTINHVHRLYLTTNKAGEGFWEVNKGALKAYSTDDIAEIIYVINQDTVKNFNQISDLVTSKKDLIRSVNYKKTVDSKLIINVEMK